MIHHSIGLLPFNDLALKLAPMGMHLPPEWGLVTPPAQPGKASSSVCRTDSHSTWGTPSRPSISSITSSAVKRSLSCRRKK